MRMNSVRSSLNLQHGQLSSDGLLTACLFSRKPKHQPRTEANCSLQRERDVWFRICFIGAGRKGSGSEAGVLAIIFHASLYNCQLELRRIQRL